MGTIEALQNDLHRLRANERIDRNLNPIPEARLAVVIRGHEYAHKQRGGSMDFRDSIGPSTQKICKDVLRDAVGAMRARQINPADVIADGE